MIKISNSYISGTLDKTILLASHGENTEIEKEFYYNPKSNIYIVKVNNEIVYNDRYRDTAIFKYNYIEKFWNKSDLECYAICKEEDRLKRENIKFKIFEKVSCLIGHYYLFKDSELASGIKMISTYKNSEIPLGIYRIQVDLEGIDDRQGIIVFYDDDNNEIDLTNCNYWDCIYNQLKTELECSKKN